METWSHPDLGLFKYDRYWWTRTFTLPSFKVFKYRYRGRNVGSSQVELRFDTEDTETVPSKQAVTIAKRIINNEETLVARLLTALHKDLQGKGPNSGMWWHGDIESIHEDLIRETGPLRTLSLDKPENLAALLGSPSIVVREFGYGYDAPLATISFEAFFEIEHGIGILTDGRKIVGTGYEMDTSPF